MANQNNLPTFTGDQFDKVTNLIKWILGTIGIVFTAIIAAFGFFFYQNMQDMKKMVSDFSTNSTNQVKSNKDFSDEQIKRLTDYSEKTIGLISSETRVIAENEVQKYFDNHSLNDIIQKKLSDQLNENNKLQLDRIEENTQKSTEALVYISTGIDKFRFGNVKGYFLLDSLANDKKNKHIAKLAQNALDIKIIDYEKTFSKLLDSLRNNYFYWSQSQINPILAEHYNYLGNYEKMLNANHEETFIAKSLIKEIEKEINSKDGDLNAIATYQYYLMYYLKKTIKLFDFDTLKEISKRPEKYIKTEYNHIGKK